MVACQPSKLKVAGSTPAMGYFFTSFHKSFFDLLSSLTLLYPTPLCKTDLFGQVLKEKYVLRHKLRRIKKRTPFQF